MNSFKCVGIDVTTISRFENMKTNIFNKMAQRILTCEEYKEFQSKRDKFKSLAVYFCAKEAVVKMLGTGFVGISFVDIMIKKNNEGKPCVYLSEKAGALAKNKGVTFIELSICHEQSSVYVVAMGG